MRRGFTLIELLAVIVILAIIAIIATPIVLNIIKDTKKSSNIRSAENYIKSIELSLANKQLSTFGLEDGVYSIDEIDVEVDGKIPNSGYIEIKNGKIEKYNVTIDNQEIDSVSTYDVWLSKDDIEEIIPEGSIYHIRKSSQLAWVAQQTNSGFDFKDATLVLDVNLDLNNKDWIPIGEKDKSFAGTFDGNNHVIKNIYINSDGVLKGLFGDVTGTIGNLIIMDSYIKGCRAIGGFVGASRANSKLYNLCIVNSKILGDISNKDNSNLGYGIGGIIGQFANILDNVKVINTYIEGSSSIGGNNRKEYISRSRSR